MFLRQTQRKKDGKTHSYWSVVENQRIQGGRVVQRHVLYLGEISPSQAAAWRKSIEVFDEDAGHSRTLALFPEDRCAGLTPDSSIVQLRLSEMRLCRPRQWGACWLAGQLWGELQLDRFWSDRLPANRKGTRWDQILQVLVSYRLIAPGSEWKLHRDWFARSAMADLLGADFRLAEPHKLYACHDFLLQHKADLFTHLVTRWRDLFNVDFDVLLYDLTSTYFEINASDVAEGDKRRHGYSRDKRPDCPQVVIALVVTPDGLPLAYEVLPGNTADCTTLRMFLARQQYGRARRVWVMDRGVPTEAVLAEMRNSDPPVQYLVGTPKGRLSRLEKDLLAKPWQQAREGVQVKLLSEDNELYVFAESVDRVSKERAMRIAPRQRQSVGDAMLDATGTLTHVELTTGFKSAHWRRCACGTIAGGVGVAAWSRAHEPVIAPCAAGRQRGRNVLRSGGRRSAWAHGRDRALVRRTQHLPSTHAYAVGHRPYRARDMGSFMAAQFHPSSNPGEILNHDFIRKFNELYVCHNVALELHPKQPK